jgi:DNA end-binding protein Ku
MAYRPSWQGHLKLSLVSCPVALYPATNSAGDVHFNLINPETNNRIKMITTDPDTGPIDRSKLVKGYEVSKGEYILLSQDEIASVKLESTKTIDIERFVATDEIDRLYWDNPYFLAPDGKIAQEAFGVIRDALAKSGQIALGRVVIGTRERILALEPPTPSAPPPRSAIRTRCSKASPPRRPIPTCWPSPRRSSSSAKAPSTPASSTTAMRTP